MGPDDTSSNPQDDDHLPVSGEFDSQNQDDRDDTALSTSADDDLMTDDEDDELSDEDDAEMQEALAEDEEMPDANMQASSDQMEKDGKEMEQP